VPAVVRGHPQVLQKSVRVASDRAQSEHVALHWAAVCSAFAASARESDVHVKKLAVLDKAGFLFMWVRRQQQTNEVHMQGQLSCSSTALLIIMTQPVDSAVFCAVEGTDTTAACQ
jgi:hypothetical protein